MRSHDEHRETNAKSGVMPSVSAASPGFAPRVNSSSSWLNDPIWAAKTIGVTPSIGLLTDDGSSAQMERTASSSSRTIAASKSFDRLSSPSSVCTIIAVVGSAISTKKTRTLERS